jgi:hypothetical protein
MKTDITKAAAEAAEGQFSSGTIGSILWKPDPHAKLHSFMGHEAYDRAPYSHRTLHHEHPCNKASRPKAEIRQQRRALNIAE